MLRDCKLFPTATSLVAMDKQAANERQSEQAQLDASYDPLLLQVPPNIAAAPHV